VQELFGLMQHPSIANGNLPLTLYLLSPAHRPIQITRDLPGFWKRSWALVKAEMKGRYSTAPLARRCRLGHPDHAGQAARDVMR
jgi:ATP-dependent helicase HrpB